QAFPHTCQSYTDAWSRRLPLTEFKENRDDKGITFLLIPLNKPGFCVARLIRIPDFFQSVVGSADLSTDRSTSPYNRSIVCLRPLHRHGPSAVFKAFPRDDQGR